MMMMMMMISYYSALLCLWAYDALETIYGVYGYELRMGWVREAAWTKGL